VTDGRAFLEAEEAFKHSFNKKGHNEAARELKSCYLRVEESIRRALTGPG